MRPKKFFILATLSTLIPLFSMHSYSKGTELAQNKLNNINDENNNFNRLNIDSRKILKRGIKPQRKSMLWPGSQDHLDFNKYWPSRFHEIKGLDKQELYNENQKLNQLVKDYYVGGELAVILNGMVIINFILVTKYLQMQLMSKHNSLSF